MTNSVRVPRPARLPFVVPLAVVVALALVLAACGGGGGGGGNGGGGTVIRVAFANQTADPATIQLDDGEPTTVESCKGGVFIFDLPATDWTVLINGETAIDSLELPTNALNANLVSEVWLREDGTIDVLRTVPGSNIQPPATLAICT